MLSKSSESSHLFDRLSTTPDCLAEFCKKWSISELSLFGSVLREDFREDSDIDVLILFQPSHHWGLFALWDMKEELAELFGKEVDLLTKPSIEHSHNWLRRKEILDSAQVIYAAQ